MKFIYARMPGYQHQTPSDVVVREIEKLGWRSVWMDNLSDTVYYDYSFVFSPYESVTLLGDSLSKKFDIPHIAHIEWFPPWRIKKDINVADFGFQIDDEELKQIDAMIEHYTEVGSIFCQASVRTLGGRCFAKYIKEFIGEDSITHFRYPSIDVETVLKTKEMYSPKRNLSSVITISRAVPNKRYDLLVDVINKVKIPVEWLIVGVGPMIEYVKINMTNKQVKVVFLGEHWGWDRLYPLLASSLLLHSWGGMPPIEAALLGCYPVLIENTIFDYNKDLFNSHIPVHRTTESAADFINNNLGMDNTVKIKQIVDLFMTNKMNVTSATKNAKDIVKRVEEQWMT